MLTVTWQKEGALVAIDRNVVVARWTSVPTSDQLDALAATHAWARRTHPRGVGLISSVSEVRGACRVDSKTQAQMMRLIHDCTRSTRAVAHVIEIRGVVGVAVRTFLHMLERLSDGTTATRAFANIDDASTWLAALLDGERWSAQELAGRYRRVTTSDALAMPFERPHIAASIAA